MTNHDYKAIADRLVERGIIDSPMDDMYLLPEYDTMQRFCVTDERVCHDWRVAGRCIERMDYDELLDMLGKRPATTIYDKVSPCDIILAYLEATDE